jgi:hypothetical protein
MSPVIAPPTSDFFALHDYIASLTAKGRHNDAVSQAAAHFKQDDLVSQMKALDDACKPNGFANTEISIKIHDVFTILLSRIEALHGVNIKKYLFRAF